MAGQGAAASETEPPETKPSCRKEAPGCCRKRNRVAERGRRAAANGTGLPETGQARQKRGGLSPEECPGGEFPAPGVRPNRSFELSLYHGAGFRSHAPQTETMKNLQTRILTLLLAAGCSLAAQARATDPELPDPALPDPASASDLTETALQISATRFSFCFVIHLSYGAGG